MANDISSLIQGLNRMHETCLKGALDGLKGAATEITLEMQSTSAHGDVTGASRASYRAYAVGRGETGSQALAASVAAVAALNPGHVATASVPINGELGVIITGTTDYQEELETENAGEKAVLGPTIASSGDRLTRAAASGSRRALGG